VIGEACTIGPNVYIERDCHIGRGVTLRDAVILRGAEIPDETSVINEVLA
jgi:NDP-sugar pyrophosphorylase family protein